MWAREEAAVCSVLTVNLGALGSESPGNKLVSHVESGPARKPPALRRHFYFFTFFDK